MAEIENKICGKCIFFVPEGPMAQKRHERLDTGFGDKLRKLASTTTDPELKKRYEKIADEVSRKRVHGRRYCESDFVYTTGESLCANNESYTPRPRVPVLVRKFDKHGTIPPSTKIH